MGRGRHPRTWRPLRAPTLQRRAPVGAPSRHRCRPVPGPIGDHLLRARHRQGLAGTRFGVRLSADTGSQVKRMVLTPRPSGATRWQRSARLAASRVTRRPERRGWCRLLRHADGHLGRLSSRPVKRRRCLRSGTRPFRWCPSRTLSSTRLWAQAPSWWAVVRAGRLAVGSELDEGLLVPSPRVVSPKGCSTCKGRG